MNVPSSCGSEVSHRSVTTSDSEKNDEALATSRYKISHGLNDDEWRMSSSKVWRPWTKMNATYRVEGELTHVVSSKYRWLLPPIIGIMPATECGKYSWLFMKMNSATSSKNYYRIISSLSPSCPCSQLSRFHPPAVGTNGPILCRRAVKHQTNKQSIVLRHVVILSVTALRPLSWRSDNQHVDELAARTHVRISRYSRSSYADERNFVSRRQSVSQLVID